jgi:hypothetical protein
MDMVDMAIHPVVCHKSSKNFRPKYDSLSKIFWCKKLAYGALQKWNKI